MVTWYFKCILHLIYFDDFNFRAIYFFNSLIKLRINLITNKDHYSLLI